MGRDIKSECVKHVQTQINPIVGAPVKTGGK